MKRATDLQFGVGLAFMLVLTACGGSSGLGSFGLGPPPPPPPGPHPNQEFLYQADITSNLITVSVVDTSGGGLSTFTQTSGGSLYNFGMIANPAANVLYVLDWQNASTIDAFSVTNPAGDLASLATVSASTHADGVAMAIDPRGRFLYLTESADDVSDGVEGTIQEFTLDTRGVPSAGAYVQSTASLGTTAIDPLSRFLYVGYAGQSGFGISVYAIDPTTGALTAVPGSPFTTGCDVEGILPEPTGRFVYVPYIPVSTGNSCPYLGFSVDGVTGVLTPIPGSPFPVPSVNGWLVLDKSGKFLYMVDNKLSGNGDVVSIFDIDPNSGALSLQSGFLTLLADAAYPVVDPSGQFLYFLESSTTSLATTWTGCRIDPATGALTRVSSLTLPSTTYPSFPVMLKAH